MRGNEKVSRKENPTPHCGGQGSVLGLWPANAMRNKRQHMHEARPPGYWPRAPRSLPRNSAAESRLVGGGCCWHHHQAR